MHLTASVPADHLIIENFVFPGYCPKGGWVRCEGREDNMFPGLNSDVLRQVFIRQEDDRIRLERFDYCDGVGDVQQISDSAFTSA